MRTLGRYRNLTTCRELTLKGDKTIAIGLRRTVRFEVDLIRVDHRR